MSPADDDPVKLQEACDIVFRGAVKVSTLRLEATRGRLEIFKVGRRQFTTLRSVRDMRDKCRENPKARGSTEIEREKRSLSETDQSSSALVALSQKTRELKRSLRNT
jgi:hypothetical protein